MPEAATDGALRVIREAALCTDYGAHRVYRALYDHLRSLSPSSEGDVDLMPYANSDGPYLTAEEDRRFGQPHYGHEEPPSSEGEQS